MPSRVATLAAGATGNFTTTVTVPTTADPGAVVLTATAAMDDRSATGTATLTVELQPGQNPSALVTDTTVANNPPKQDDDSGIDKAFDGDTTTIYHSPWDGSGGRPLNIDLNLGETALELASLEVVPRQGGVNNGRWNGYEVWAGDDADSLTKIAEGNMPDTSALQSVSLSGSAKFLRLRVLSSYGSTADEVDDYVFVAEIRVRALVADSEVRSCR